MSTGAISLAATFRINVGMESGPAALLWSNLAIPFALNVMFDIEGCGLGPLSGILLVSSLYKLIEIVHSRCWLSL